MAINTNLLVAAPILQDYFVDSVTAQAMAGGVITMYRDNARTVLKNWYYQTGSAGAYTYLPLANPLTLSAVGTITDPAGNDTIPFYYPFDENNDTTQQPYYVTVVDSNGQAQFTRQNFPFQAEEATPGAELLTLRNYITNNVYWRNIGTQNLTAVTDAVVAPSQHDGYTNPDIRFLKSVVGATDTISFIPMTQQLTNDITPETQLNFTCTSVQAGETQKCIQYPLSLHVNTLADVTNATFVINAQNAGSSGGSLQIYLYQFLGTGAIVQPAPILLDTFVLSAAYQKFSVTFDFPPPVAQADLGLGGDDAFFIQVGYPLSTTFAINHTKPQFYLSSNVPTNDFDTYEDINAVISSARTGDFRITLNKYSLFGQWIGLNDGTIGSPASAAEYNTINCWPLYNLLWNEVGIVYAPMEDGQPYGATAYIDWSANRGMFMTKTLGRAIACVGTPSTGGTQRVPGEIVGTQNSIFLQNQLPVNMTGIGISSNGFSNTAGGGSEIGVGGGTTTNVTLTNTGGGQPVQYYQPTSFNNMYMKL